MYEIIEVPADAVSLLEPMGTRPKFWFEHATLGESLFKVARPGSGEDWSEKLAEQLAARLGLPHATYELAEWNGSAGTVSPKFSAEGEQLVHGNELLGHAVSHSDGVVEYLTTEQTLSEILAALSRNVEVPVRWAAPDGISTAAGVFTGYLLLDALVGNTDRHHANWAILEVPAVAGSLRPTLAPTFDHASCLGRNESDDVRRARLDSNDAGYSVEAYAARARSSIYREENDPRPMGTVEAFEEIAIANSSAAKIWGERLRSLRETDFELLASAVPRRRLSPTGAEIATRMLRHNRARILQTIDGL